MSNKMSAVMFSALIYNNEFLRKVYPHMKKEYFDGVYQHAFQMFSEFYDKFKSVPPYDAMEVELGDRPGLSESDYQHLGEIFERIYSEATEEQIRKMSLEWLIDKTQEHCLNKSAYMGVMEAMSILDGSNSAMTKSAIPDILRESLNINFDTTFGHSYLDDAAERYEYYHRKEYKLKFPLKMLNLVTKGGIPPKSLLLFIAPTGLGKTLMKTFCATHFLMEGHDVLYVTLEMAEERIAERMDATLLDVTLDDLKMVLRDKYIEKIDKLKAKTTGKLLIKEFPPGSISAANIRSMLDELAATKNFKPKVLFVDYLNLMKSSRLKAGDGNEYKYIKYITEELRAIAVDYNLLLVTSTQTNRGGLGSKMYDLTEISESVGMAFTADAIFAMMSNDELEELGQMRIAQFKNRFGPLTPKSFIVGVDRPKMKFYDVDLDFEPPPERNPNNPALPGPKERAKPSIDGFKI